MIKVAIFDLDNTLTDFMRMKESAVEAAVDAMIDAGLRLPAKTINKKIYDVYEEVRETNVLLKKLIDNNKAES